MCSVTLQELAERMASMVDSQELQATLNQQGHTVQDVAMLFADQRVYTVPGAGLQFTAL